MEMDKIFYYNSLYDIYKELLTDKQKSYYEAFYFDNQSLQEIGDAYGVSKNAIFTQLNNTVDALIKYEEALKLNEKNKKLDDLFKSLKELGDEKINHLIESYSKEN